MPPEETIAETPDGDWMTHPGLTALVVCLRPVGRPDLLAGLARLGLFVLESPGAEESLQLRNSSLQPDLAIIAGDCSVGHAAAIRTVAEGLTPAVVALCPPDADTSAVHEAGAVAVAAGDSTSNLTSLIAPVARFARSRQRPPEAGPDAPVAVFGTLRLKSEPARLESGGRLIKLSEMEHAVLGTLARRKGDPVGTAELSEAVHPKKGLQAADVGPALIAPTVARLRRKAARLGGEPLALSSVRGFGYVLTE